MLENLNRMYSSSCESLKAYIILLCVCVVNHLIPIVPHAGVLKQKNTPHPVSFPRRFLRDTLYNKNL